MNESDTRPNQAAPNIHFERDRGVYRVESIDGLAHVVVMVGREEHRIARISGVFRALADARIPIFLIKLHGLAVTFAIEAHHVPAVESALSGMPVDCSWRGGLALATVVATSMRDLTGVMVDIADSLQAAGARLYGMGDSHNTVQCLIDAAHLQQAVTALRLTFHLEGAHA